MNDPRIPTMWTGAIAFVAGICVAALALLPSTRADNPVPITTTTTEPCEEDDYPVCWDCETMGNLICGPTTTELSYPANEDEIIVWTEDAHDACVPLDNLWQAEDGSIVWDKSDETPCNK
jgi:hypothetical protein